MNRLLSFVISMGGLTMACGQAELPAVDVKQVAAFPGAEGYGKFATGGRGGVVLVVTNLNDKGPGSLREAIGKKGARVIVFAVSGTIALESDLTIRSGDVTIAGQSAPGDGICLRNYQFGIGADNVIIRYMRFRLGDEKSVQGDAFGGTRHKNIIIDHCSISWATDECASFYYNEDFTLQWCIISESLNASVHEKGEHGYGGIWGGSRVSFHHNLLAHHASRLPRFSGSSTTVNAPDELVDFRNNVIYNWQHNNTYGGERGRYNMVNNYYKSGPATQNSRKNQILNPSEPYGGFYLQGNVLADNTPVTQSNRLGVLPRQSESALVETAFPVMDMPTESAQDAYAAVLKSAGASFSRDAVDLRIVEEVATRSARYGKQGDGIIDSQQDVGGWPVLNMFTPRKDSDQDGIPDDWEKEKGLNPADASDGRAYGLSKSYTNVEVYLNTIVR